MSVCGTLWILYIGVHLPQWTLRAVRHGHDRRDHTARASAACKSMMIKTVSVCACAYNMNTSDDVTKQLGCCSYVQKASLGKHVCILVQYTLFPALNQILFLGWWHQREGFGRSSGKCPPRYSAAAQWKGQKNQILSKRDGVMFVCVLLTCLWFPRRECVLLLFLCCPGFEGYS